MSKQARPWSLGKTGPKPKTLAERFAGKYRIDEAGHWIWLGAVTKSGYGKILAADGGPGRHRLIGAHVASYVIHNGPLPEHTEIDHLCRLTLCVCPSHLEAVTRAENGMRRWRAQRAGLPPQRIVRERWRTGLPLGLENPR